MDFFFFILIEHFRKGGWKPSIGFIFRESNFDLLGAVGFRNMLTNDFYLNIFLQLRL